MSKTRFAVSRQPSMYSSKRSEPSTTRIALFAISVRYCCQTSSNIVASMRPLRSSSMKIMRLPRLPRSNTMPAIVAGLPRNWKPSLLLGGGRSPVMSAMRPLMIGRTSCSNSSIGWPVRYKPERLALAVEPHAAAPVRQHFATERDCRSGAAGVCPSGRTCRSGRRRARASSGRQLHRCRQRVHQRRAVRAEQSSAPERISASSTRRLMRFWSMRRHRSARSRNAPCACALGDQHLDDRLPDALDRAEAVADAALAAT